MIKQSICVLAAILILSTKNEAVAQKIKLLKKTHLADYPSASSLEIYKDRIYVVGDDARNIWVLDKDYNFLDSIHVFDSKEKRIDRMVKADLESSVILNANGKDYLVAFSSFSTPTRNKLVILDLSEKKIIPKIINDTVDKTGIAELNIEGAALVHDQLLLTNRANTTHTENSLILTSVNTEHGIGAKNKKLIPFRLPKVKGGIIGISGIAYVPEKDLLFFSASTEDTPNAYTDGTIGGSYIGYVKNISKKLNGSFVKADKLIPVSKYLNENTAQKIESATVEKMEDNKLIVHLAADNDNGESTLFKLKVRL